MTLTVYGDSRSGNCLKVRWLLDRLGRAYDWLETDIMTGVTRMPDFLALNPAGQVPLVVLEDRRTLAQSNAILAHFGEGTDLIPADAYQRARMFEWLFWEQYSHEPYVAVARFRMAYEGLPREALERYELFGAEEYAAVLAPHGFRVIHNEVVTQPGYVQALQDYSIESVDAGGDWEPWFPPTNGLWVFERP